MSARRGGGAGSKGGAGGTRNAVTYSLGDIVLGKVRGYAPWPGIVVDPDAVAEKVAAERPGGKKTTFYCVRFFPNGEHAWLVEKDMSRLQPHEISAYLSEPKKKGGKSGDILEAYKIAQDPTAWLKKKEAEAAEEEDEEANAEVDQLDEPHSEIGSTASGAAPSKSSKSKNTTASSSSRKRKRDNNAGESASAVSSKAKKQPKTSAAAKKEKDESASAVSKRGGGGKGGKRNGASAKSKALVESEDEGDHGRSASGAEDNAGSSSKKAAGSPPPAKKAKKDAEGDEAKDDPDSVKVRDWRHKLQKTFLSPKAPPKDEDMPDLDKLFKTVEDCENITIEQLQFSKIGKVMRHIAALTESAVPRDNEYRFRERAKALVERWQGILSASKTAGGASTPGGKANGSSSSPGKEEPSKKDDEKKEEGGAEDAEGERDEDEQGQQTGEEGDGGVTEGTAAINLNGKDAEMVDAVDAPQGSTVAATETGKDVDMAEA